MSLASNDRDEWRSARDHAERTRDAFTHPMNCRCRDCAADELTEERP